MGLEPTRCNQHKILSLARLPIPTLPHALPKRKMQEMGLEPTLCCHNRHLTSRTSSGRSSQLSYGSIWWLVLSLAANKSHYIGHQSVMQVFF